MPIVVELGRAIDGDLATDIETQSAYISPAFKSVRIRPDSRAVECELSPGSDEDEARAKVLRFVEAMASRHRRIERKVIAQRQPERTPRVRSGVQEQLRERGWLFDLGRGQVGLGGPAFALVRKLDADCVDLARRTFGAAERVYPSLIPTGVLGRCGYFGSFPHSVSFVAHLVEDFDRIEAFRAANSAGGVLEIPNRADMVFDACLAPAVCYHVYQSFEGTVLGPSGAAITAAGKCFRYESSNLSGLERLWDFTMREVVFLGSAEQVTKRRQEAIAAVVEQLERWDLEGTIVTANDPFFPTTYATKRYWQLVADMKFELRLPIEGPSESPRTIAACSFNLHESFFGEAFRVSTEDGGRAFTACVGWGLERCVLACFAQHGFVPGDWPESLRDVFEA
jgi:seryl-tRNA synthetase